MKKLLLNMGLVKPVMSSYYFILSIKNNVFQFVNEFFYRMPYPQILFNKKFASDSSEMKEATSELRNDGITILNNYIKGEQLQTLVKAFEEMIEIVEKNPSGPMKLTPDGGSLHPQSSYAEQGYDTESKIAFSNNPFQFSKNFLDVALDDYILGIVEGYICKKFMLQQAIASRYYPYEKTNFGSWQWHHDSWGRKVNVMILFNDVTEKDQYMSFMKGSHKIYHSYERTTINDRYTEEEVQEQCGQEVVKCIGKAGTVFIFDANGFHRGNRTLGAPRDSLITQYTAGRYLWSFDIPKKFVNNLDNEKTEFLMQNPNINLF